MNVIIEDLRERAATVTASSVNPDWTRLRRARRARRTSLATGTTIGAIVVLGVTGVGYHMTATSPPTVLAVIATPPGPAAAVVSSAVASTPVALSPAVPAAAPVTDDVEQPLTSYAGRSLAQLAQECQTWAPGVATPGSDPQIRGLVADSAGAEAAITTDKEASTCEFLPDGSVDTSGANAGPYGIKNPADRLFTRVSPITLGSDLTHRLDSKDRGLKTPVRDDFVARVGRDVAYIVVNFGGHTVRSTPGQGVVTATYVTGGSVTKVHITYAAYDRANHVISTDEDTAADYTRCGPLAGTQRNGPTACLTISWP